MSISSSSVGRRRRPRSRWRRCATCVARSAAGSSRWLRRPARGTRSRVIGATAAARLRGGSRWPRRGAVRGRRRRGFARAATRAGDRIRAQRARVAAVAQRRRPADAPAVQDERVGGARPPRRRQQRRQLRLRPSPDRRCGSRPRRLATRSTWRSTGKPGHAERVAEHDVGGLAAHAGQRRRARPCRPAPRRRARRPAPAPCPIERLGLLPEEPGGVDRAARRSAGVGRRQRRARRDSARTAPASPRSRARRWTAPTASSRPAVRTALRIVQFGVGVGMLARRARRRSPRRRTAAWRERISAPGPSGPWLPACDSV